MRKKLYVIVVRVFLLSVVSFALALTAYGSDASNALVMPEQPQEPQVVKQTRGVEQILVYTDDYVLLPQDRYPIVALDNLGKSYTHVIDDPATFATSLASQPWDIVIVSHNNYYEMGNNWTELEAYVLGGGRLAISTFDVDGSHSEATTLWNTLGAIYYTDNPTAVPVYRWGVTPHTIFTHPNAVGDLITVTDQYIDDGDDVTWWMTPVAGFTASATANNAAIVDGGETILMSFLLCEFRTDQDTDGKLDAVELWENVIHYLQYTCGDINGDGAVDVTDITYFINWMLRTTGPPPQCPPTPYMACADCNGDGDVGTPDIVYLINYVLKSGPPPIC